jgi:hypothetical protein
MRPVNTLGFVATLNRNYIILEFTSLRYITFIRVEVLENSSRPHCDIQSYELKKLYCGVELRKYRVNLPNFVMFLLLWHDSLYPQLKKKVRVAQLIITVVHRWLCD